MLFTETFCIIVALLFLIFGMGSLVIYLIRGFITLFTGMYKCMGWILSGLKKLIIPDTGKATH